MLLFALETASRAGSGHYGRNLLTFVVMTHWQSAPVSSFYSNL